MVPLHHIHDREPGMAKDRVIEGVNTPVVGPAVGQRIQHPVDSYRISYAKTSDYTAHNTISLL